MKLDVVLCNHAEAVNNLLYISGGGINVAQAPPGAPPPYGISVGIGLLITVPWQQTNQQHKAEITLLTEDGAPAMMPIGSDGNEPLNLVLAFNVGRPANLGVGDDQVVALAANLVGLPFPALGKYEFQVSMDGNPERRIGIRIVSSPGGQVLFG
ncbi:MAG: hypothetical protein M3Z25_02590 [Actinomycetota bacterium]|nr:hypothetical protein [Actinomycetota bacterium]